METPKDEHQIYEYFLISIILKGLISLAEVVAGTALLLIPRSVVVDFVQMTVQIAQSSPSFGKILTPLTHELSAFTAGTVVFLALYLLSRGLVKVLLIGGLLKNKLWAYPASLLVLGLFMLYQVYQIITTHSVLVVGLTLFDAIVMYFIWREYNIVRSHQTTPSLAV